jgi:hypothetical protein
LAGDSLLFTISPFPLFALCASTDPHQHLAVLVHRKFLDLDQFFLQCVELFFAEVEF